MVLVSTSRMRKRKGRSTELYDRRLIEGHGGCRRRLGAQLVHRDEGLVYHLGDEQALARSWMPRSSAPLRAEVELRHLQGALVEVAGKIEQARVGQRSFDVGEAALVRHDHDHRQLPADVGQLKRLEVLAAQVGEVDVEAHEGCVDLPAVEQVESLRAPVENGIAQGALR